MYILDMHIQTMYTHIHMDMSKYNRFNGDKRDIIAIVYHRNPHCEGGL
jgi:hypothetical protein